MSVDGGWCPSNAEGELETVAIAKVEPVANSELTRSREDEAMESKTVHDASVSR